MSFLSIRSGRGLPPFMQTRRSNMAFRLEEGPYQFTGPIKAQASARANDPQPAKFPEPACSAKVLTGSWEISMDKKTADKLDPKAKGRKTSQADFDRNRDGLYGGLPKARDNAAPGPASKHPHPSR